MKSKSYNQNEDISKTVELLIDLQWYAPCCDYEFYQKMIDDLSSKKV